MTGDDRMHPLDAHCPSSGRLFIIVDGDDIGRKITHCYVTNDSRRLAAISRDVNAAVTAISELLKSLGFRVIFCAADGVVASVDNTFDPDSVMSRVRTLSPEGVTFSAGVGGTLQQAYVALTEAKCSGKNAIVRYR